MVHNNNDLSDENIIESHGEKSTDTAGLSDGDVGEIVDINNCNK